MEKSLSLITDALPPDHQQPQPCIRLARVRVGAREHCGPQLWLSLTDDELAVEPVGVRAEWHSLCGYRLIRGAAEGLGCLVLESREPLVPGAPSRVALLWFPDSQLRAVEEMLSDYGVTQRCVIPGALARWPLVGVYARLPLLRPVARGAMSAEGIAVLLLVALEAALRLSGRSFPSAFESAARWAGDLPGALAAAASPVLSLERGFGTAEAAVRNAAASAAEVLQAVCWLAVGSVLRLFLRLPAVVACIIPIEYALFIAVNSTVAMQRILTVCMPSLSNY
eukprot:m51a1_g14686 hypothetical protein (281) ;mRNA; r:92212-95929